MFDRKVHRNLGFATIGVLGALAIYLSPFLVYGGLAFNHVLTMTLAAAVGVVWIGVFSSLVLAGRSRLSGSWSNLKMVLMP